MSAGISEQMGRTERCWYFAYGANMARQVLVERRGLRPLSGEAAAVRGWELSFTTPGFWPEPAFANIERAPDGVVHGVLYRLEEAQLEILTAHEGGSYQQLEVEAHGARSGSVTAIAFHCLRRCRGGLPSRRYLQLLEQGAAEWSLPAAYRESVLARQPSLHVPVLSMVVSGVIAFSAALSRAGLRPESALTRLATLLQRIGSRR